MAERLDVGVVSIGSGGAQNEEVTAAGAMAHPLKCGIEVFAPSNKCKPGFGAGFHVSGITDPEVPIWFRLSEDSCLSGDNEKQSQNF